jgi:FHA domain/von Willebrand factor type A domain
MINRKPRVLPNDEGRMSKYEVRMSMLALRTSRIVLRTSHFVLRTSHFALRTSHFDLRPSTFGLRHSPFALPSSRWRLRTIVALPLLFVLSNPAGFLAQRSVPLDVLIVFDQSRSMKQNDPQRVAAQAVSQFIQQLSSENSAGLILFGSQAWSVQGLRPLNEGHRRQLLASIADVRYADAQSNPAAAVDTALDEFRGRSRTEGMPVMILFTDGGIDTGSKARDAEIQNLMETQVLAEVRKQKVRIYTIAFTTDADLSLLEKISRDSGGECYLALTPDALEPAFRRLAAAIDKLTKPVPADAQPVAETTSSPEGLKQSPSSIPPLPPAPAGFSKTWFTIGLAGLIGLLAAGSFFFFFLKPKLARQTGELVPEAALIELRTGKPFRIAKTVVQIGRKADNDLVIAEQTVSGQHARIRYRKGKFYLEDLQSANETKVNGQKVIGEVELRSGDVVRFDQFGYTFKGPDTDADRTMLRS